MAYSIDFDDIKQLITITIITLSSTYLRIGFFHPKLVFPIPPGKTGKYWEKLVNAGKQLQISECKRYFDFLNLMYKIKVRNTWLLKISLSFKIIL